MNLISSSTNNRKQLLAQLLQAEFKPVTLEVIDESHLHANHPGAKESGGGHFNITIVANAFENMSRLARHKLVYQAVASMLEKDIHALSINAKTPLEAKI